VSRNPVSLDADALMRAVNPAAEPPLPDAVDLALQRLLEATEPTVAAAAGRRRLALAGGLLVAAVAAGFAVVNLLPASSTNSGVGAAWAKNVIARSAGVAAGVGDGILHIEVRVTEKSAARSDNVRYRVESWAKLDAPRAFWETIVSRSDATTTTVVGDHVESYDSATNTLAGATKQIGSRQPRAALFDPAYHAALSVLYRKDGADRVPPSFPQLVARLIRSPNVTVDGNATLDGNRAVSITSLHGRAILYLQPRTYTPLEFVMHGDPGSTTASITTIVMRFDTYETLPRGAVDPPNLRKLHPGARPSSE
jgi:hypothetical protein